MTRRLTAYYECLTTVALFPPPTLALVVVFSLFGLLVARLLQVKNISKHLGDDAFFWTHFWLSLWMAMCHAIPSVYT